MGVIERNIIVKGERELWKKKEKTEGKKNKRESYGKIY